MTSPSRRLLCLLVLLQPSTLGTAQTSDVAALAAEPSVRTALDIARRSEEDTIQQQIRLCEIPAPPFGEAKRAAAYAQAMREAGLTNVRIDAEGNVLGERPGRNPRPHLVLSAHLDTVFPAEVSVRVTRDKNLLHGPGIGDDCRGLAVLLAVARALNAAQVRTDGPITFVGTVGEEGLGDLRGVKALFAGPLRQSDRFVSVDGDRYGITNVGVGSRRYRVTFRGPGGHSYDNFGRANPVHALGSAIARIARLDVPVTPRTTFSVGRIGGGTSVNAIATEAWMEVDLRSSDAAALSQLEAGFQASVRSALEEENTRRRNHEPLTVDIEQVGNRPAGRTAADSRIVETTTATLNALSLPVRLDEGSTDANLPMSLGIQAITIGGGGVGRDVHSPRESFDTTDSWRGTQLVTLLAVALAR
ncbi:MAG TPA: M20/M25/M40 family metallo-hydrolase [Vicinamibacterales bacterium]|nr:M20/M25/M40 family metallo-hydrolase [Vicinamibacterales bacterium]